MVLIRSLIVLALLLAPGWQVVRGERFDTYAFKLSAARRVSLPAEEAAARFVELLGSFPGDRAALVVRGGKEPDGTEDPDWRKAGAAWSLTIGGGPGVVEMRPGVREDLGFFRGALPVSVFRGPLAQRMLLEWADLRAPDPPKGDGSGTRLPDWWEDAVAGWCEERTVRDRRRRTMGDVLALRKELPLDRMLSLVRGADPGYAEVPGGVVDGKGLPPEILERLKAPYRLPVLPVQSLSFLEYLVENEGVGFVRHAADLQSRGLGLGNALPWLGRNSAERAKPKTPVPGTIRDLEKAWLAWALARKP